MDELANFHSIQSINDLPEGRCSAIDIGARNESEARQYAQQYTTRQIYWIDEIQMGIWYQLLRRTGDLSMRRLA